jgi:hypothetical protein
MSVLIQSSGPVAQSYSVILHYSYPDTKTGEVIKGKVEGLISAAEYIAVRVPGTDVPVSPKITVVPPTAPILSTPEPTHTTTFVPTSVVPSGRVPTPIPTLPPPPLSNVFVSVESMSQPRMNHGAVRLRDGTVLVAGGSFGTNNTLDSSEIFDPTTEKWTEVSNMNIARDDFSMTLLSDGRVLATGGQDSRGELNSAEIYDPDSGAWQLVGAMMVPRSHHTATSLTTGQVLVVGGYAYESAPDGNDLISRQDTAEVFDPGTNTFYQTGNLTHPRVHHDAVQLSDGKILVAGGLDDEARKSVEIFDPTTGTFAAAPDLVYTEGTPNLILLANGNVIAIGTGDTSARVAELYNPARGSVSVVHEPISHRSSFTVTLLRNQKVLITGGAMLGSGASAIAELYDPETESIVVVGPMGQPRQGHRVVELVDGRVLVTGGRYDMYGLVGLTSVEIYYP